MNGRMIVVPSESTALAKLEWVADSNELHITYTSNEQKSYVMEKVDWASIRGLFDAVDVHGSWGSALHYWKESHVEFLSAQDDIIVDGILAELGPRIRGKLLEALEADIGPANARTHARIHDFVKRW